MVAPFYVWLRDEKGIDCFQQDIKVPWRYHEEWFALQEADALRALEEQHKKGNGDADG